MVQPLLLAAPEALPLETQGARHPAYHVVRLQSRVGAVEVGDRLPPPGIPRSLPPGPQKGEGHVQRQHVGSTGADEGPRETQAGLRSGYREGPPQIPDTFIQGQIRQEYDRAAAPPAGQQRPAPGGPAAPPRPPAAPRVGRPAGRRRSASPLSPAAPCGPTPAT